MRIVLDDGLDPLRTWDILFISNPANKMLYLRITVKNPFVTELVNLHPVSSSLINLCTSVCILVDCRRHNLELFLKGSFNRFKSEVSVA
jgi:hypothetical protein